MTCISYHVICHSSMRFAWCFIAFSAHLFCVYCNIIICYLCSKNCHKSMYIYEDFVGRIAIRIRNRSILLVFFLPSLFLTLFHKMIPLLTNIYDRKDVCNTVNARTTMVHVSRNFCPYRPYINCHTHTHCLNHVILSQNRII